MAGCCSCKAWKGSKRDKRLLIIAEVLRYIVMVIPVYLGIWRYAEIGGYTIFIKNANVRAQFWGVITAIIVGITLVLYLPAKITVLKCRIKEDMLSGLAWRPSIVNYILFSATPVFLMIVIASKRDGMSNTYMDSVTVVVLQACVLGLTVTEWISKLREEHLTFDLVSAAANDFFFAYDVIDFVMMGTQEEEIYHSNWVYACFAFAYVAMFKYVPAQPINITGESGPRTQCAILVSMFCCDVPFVIIRLCTMIIFNFRVSDLLHPVKNIALITFDIMQLVILSRLKDHPDPPEDITDGIIPHVVPQTRRARKETDDERDTGRVHPTSGSGWDLVRRRILNGMNDERQNHVPIPTVVNNATFEDDGGRMVGDNGDVTGSATNGHPVIT